jgi:glycerol-3-phosphate dehydrogenase
MRLGAGLNDLLAYKRNGSVDEHTKIPGARLLSRDEYLKRLPGTATDGVTGGVLWYDGQVTNTERLLLAIVASAAAAGAHVANYVEATGLLRSDDRVSGVIATDALGGQELSVRARLVILCAGVWTDSLLNRFGVPQMQPAFRPSLAVNLITRQLCGDYAMALHPRFADGESSSASLPRTLFIVPWQQYSIAGTLHLPCALDREPCAEVDDDTIARFLTAINVAYPQARLTFADVRHVHAGFLPARVETGRSARVRLARESQVVDHAATDGIAGLITVSGVKYTTARHTAQTVTDLALNKLARMKQRCVTHLLPVAGGETGDLAAFLAGAEQNTRSCVDTATIRHLATSYGASYSRILEYAEQQPSWRRPVSTQSPVLAAEVVHAVREEMAFRLADVVRRRTTLGSAGLPDAPAVKACADIMGQLLDWTPRKRQSEIDWLYGSYERRARPERAEARP